MPGVVSLSVSCHTRATGFCDEVPLGPLRDGLGQGSLPVLGGVQIDQRGPAAGMAHAFHQLTEAGVGLGHQVIARVAQVVKVDAGQAGGGECRRPRGAPEVAMPEQLSARRSEQQRIGGRASVVVEMLLNLSDDAARQDDAALAGGGFGRSEERRLAASLGELAADADGCRCGVDVAAAERDELAQRRPPKQASRIRAR